MTGPSTAREALIAETLGAIAPLIERVQAVVPELESSRAALLQASEALAAQADAFERRMAALADHAKLHAVQHIARRTDELARVSLAAQRRAMEDAARTAFRAEAEPALQRLVAPLQRVGDLAHEAAHPWQRWLAHAATAALSCSLTWALASGLGCR